MREFVNVANGCENVCTTSSCSGRVSVLAERTEEDVNANRKGGEWVFVSHEASRGERFDNEDQRKFIVDREEENADITV